MEIICNKCGAVIPKPEMKTIRDGEIEHTYFLCPDYGEAYRASTTDKHLRKRIPWILCCKRTKERKEALVWQIGSRA